MRPFRIGLFERQHVFGREELRPGPGRVHEIDDRGFRTVPTEEEQRATSPSVVIVRGYLLDFPQLETDLIAGLGAIEEVVTTEGHAVFSMGPDRPTRAQLLPLISEVG